MALRSLGALAFASASAVSAFQNTSPFFLFSNTEPLRPFDNGSPQVQSAQVVDTLVLQGLQDCAPKGTSDNYIIVQQDGVSASDYQDGRAAPHLSRWLGGKDSEIKQTMVVPEVVGTVGAEAIQQSINSRCGGSAVTSEGGKEEPYERDAAYPRVFTINFPAPPAEDPASKLFEYDSILNDFILSHFTNKQWTVFYTTTPRDERIAEELVTQTYEMDDPFPNAVNMEMKRDVVSHANDNELEGGLFEKYMFLSPGMFMGLTAAVPLFLILYVGISALSGLEVSYFAFSKEMGPAGQKKQ